MQTPTATYFYHLDPLGSVAEMSDSNGNIVASYHYEGFGNVVTDGTNPPANPLLFQGQYFDSATGLYYMRARYYDPTVGRFTQRDPVAQTVGNPAISPYVFAGNRPTVFTDPTGMSAVATKIFLGHATFQSSEDADTNYVATVGKLGIRAVSYFGKYGSALAEAQRSGVFTDAADTGYGLKAGGDFLSVIGIGLQTMITVQDCLYGTVAQCVGDTIGTAVSIGFTVGCAFVTAGVASAACAIGGGLLSAGLSFAISNYGPQLISGWSLTQGEVALGVFVGCTVLTGGTGAPLCAGAGYLAGKYWPQISSGFITAGDAIAGFAPTAGDALATGYNKTVSAISTGFDTEMSTLKDAGYTAAQLALVLVSVYAIDLTDTLNALIGLGYGVEDVATALEDTFDMNPDQAAQVLKGTFDYTVDQVAGALKDVYSNLSDGELALALKGADYTVEEVGSALDSVYADTAPEAAAALNSAKYAIGQVADTLNDVYTETDQEEAVILKGLGYPASQVMGEVESVYQDSAQLAATALQNAQYGFEDIATALSDEYAADALEAATILKNLSAPWASIAGSLDSTFGLADGQAAQLLDDLGPALLILHRHSRARTRMARLKWRLPSRACPTEWTR